MTNEVYMIYPLFIFKTESGTYDGYFPDVEGCLFSGDTFEDAIRDAETSFGQHIEVLTEQAGHVRALRYPVSYLGDKRLTKDDGFVVLVEMPPTK